MKYRKKPVVIEALQFRRDNRKEMQEFTKGAVFGISVPKCPDGVMEAYVDTLEGEMVAAENDYIVKGIQGEFYAVKPDIFKRTYEKAN